MTTDVWTSSVSQANDAAFRAWGSDLSARLAAIGLVQTADTGQIDWTSVTIPGTNNTAAGYEIWRFDDTLQGTAPIFIKLEYGRSSASNYIGFWVTVGTGTDGAGTITGTFTDRLQGSTNTAPSSGTNNSYLCCVDGHVALAFYIQNNKALLAFSVTRSCDASGTPTEDGVILVTGGSSISTSATSNVQCLRFSGAPVALPASTSQYISIFPQTLSSYTYGTDMQLFSCWMALPQVFPVFSMIGYMVADIVEGDVFSHAMIGATPRTYVAVSRSLGTGGFAGSGFCMLWE